MRTVLTYVCDVCEETDEDESRMQRHEAYCMKRKKCEDDERARRAASGHLAIRQVIDRCGLLERHETLPVRIKDETGVRFHDWFIYGTSSYRGSYDELAVLPIDPQQCIPHGLNRSHGLNLKQFTAEMEYSLRRTYSGWRGGDYTMHEHTFVWIARAGESGGLLVTDVRLAEDGSCVWLVGRLARED